MPKQMGLNPIIGTYGDQTFYKVDDVYYVKKKNSYTVNRAKAPGYLLYKANIAAFGESSKIVKEIYRDIDESKKKHGMFGKITGEVRRLMKENVPVEEIKEQMRKQYLES